MRTVPGCRIMAACLPSHRTPCRSGSPSTTATRRPMSSTRCSSAASRRASSRTRTPRTSTASRSGATLLPPRRPCAAASPATRTAAPPWPRATAGRCWSPAGTAARTSRSRRPPTNWPRKVLDEATEGAADEPEPQPENVTMGFWYVSPRRGPHRTTRQISAGTWDEVRAQLHRPGRRGDGRPDEDSPRRTSRAGCCCCTARPAPARPRRCAPWPAPGGSGARWTASWTRSGSSTTSAI